MSATDQPSATMWCAHSANTWSSSASAYRSARSSPTCREVERLPPRLAREAQRAGLALGGRQVAQVDAREDRFRWRHHALHGRPVDRGKAAAQHLVAAHQREQRSLERARVERTAQALGHRQVVGRGAGRHLLEEPEALLRVGKRRVPRGHGRAAQVLEDLVLARGELGLQFAREQAPRPAALQPVALRQQLDPECGHAGEQRVQSGIAPDHGASTPATAARAPAMESTRFARPATVVSSKSTRTDRSMPKARRRREATCVASSELPPRS